MDEFLRNEGFMRDELIEGKDYQEVPYKNLSNGLYLELHMNLFAQESGAYGHFNELFADAFDTCIETEIQEARYLRSMSENISCIWYATASNIFFTVDLESDRRVI